MKRSPPLVVLLGQTASGKSAVAAELARALEGEVVNADSRQIYRYLESGTAQPKANERRRIPHHLYGFLEPDRRFSAGEYARRARRLIRAILARGKSVVVAGGTGLYLRALFQGLADLPERDEKIRAELEAVACGKGRKALHAELEKVDAKSAEKIPYQNIQRVIRALEVYRLTGKPLSHWHEKGSKRARGLHPLYFGLSWQREDLEERIARRCQRILPGLIRETRRALMLGFGPESPGLEGLGYSDALLFLKNEISREELLSRLLRQTRRYAKRQRTWFKREPAVCWIPLRKPFRPSETAKQILGHL